MEVLVTNLLDSEHFPSSEFKESYHLRWGGLTLGRRPFLFLMVTSPLISFLFLRVTSPLIYSSPYLPYLPSYLRVLDGSNSKIRQPEIRDFVRGLSQNGGNLFDRALLSWEIRSNR